MLFQKNQNKEWVKSGEMGDPFTRKSSTLKEVMTSQKEDRVLAVSRDGDIAILLPSDKKHRNREWIFLHRAKNDGADRDKLSQRQAQRSAFSTYAYAADDDRKPDQLIGWDEKRDIIFIEKPNTAELIISRLNQEYIEAKKQWRSGRSRNLTST